MANRQISNDRKSLYHLGQIVSGIGLLMFLGSFVVAASQIARPSPLLDDSLTFHQKIDGHRESMRQSQSAGGTFVMLGIGGFVLIAIGGGLMSVGKRGLAGSGVVLDPEQAREDVEPWSRMTGGVIKDTLDEAGVDLGQIASNLSGGRGGDDLPFDEKLRRLHALHEDGILSADEYEREKRELLDSN